MGIFHQQALFAQKFVIDFKKLYESKTQPLKILSPVETNLNSDKQDKEPVNKIHLREGDKKRNHKTEVNLSLFRSEEVQRVDSFSS